MNMIRIKKKMEYRQARYYVQKRKWLFFWEDVDWDYSLRDAINKARQLKEYLDSKKTFTLAEAKEEYAKQKISEEENEADKFSEKPIILTDERQKAIESL